MRYAFSRVAYDPSEARWRTEYYERWVDEKSKLHREQWLHDSESDCDTEDEARLAGITESTRMNEYRGGERRRQLHAECWCCLWLAARCSVTSNQRWLHKLKAGYLRDEILGLD